MYKITAAILLLFAWSAGLYAQDESSTDELQAESALDKRISIERKTLYESFVITPHKPNYILPIAYNDRPNYDPNNTGVSSDLDKNEVKFQMSMKFPIAEDLFGEEGSLFFAYTNLSFWQAYNGDTSRPFRETNHEPELFLIFPVEFEVLGMRNRLIQLGIVHQSNGRSDPDSRSWNRLYLDFIFQHNDFYLSLKPWVRLTGGAKDDNPDIQDYLGHGEIRGVYSNGYHTVSLMLRNNLSSSNLGAVELNWSFPMSRRAKWFVQYFNGYGESLIDYNARVNRFGVGIAFTDWL
jgi:phospholipase A1